MTYINRHWRIVACAVGLMAWLAASVASAQFLPLDPTQVVINADGGKAALAGMLLKRRLRSR
jgi:hypothetical protein